MRTIIITFFSLFLFVGLQAQNEVIVLHVSGLAQYYPHYGAKPVNLYPGQELEVKGKLRCKGAGSVKLLYEGTPIIVSGSKMRDMEEIVRTATQTSQLSFTGRFFSFLNESVKEGVTDEKLKKHHRRYMSKSSGGVKGWAKPEYTIKALLLTTGKLPSAHVIFKWRNTPGEGPYTFSLLSQQNKTIAQLMVRDTAITLDLEQLALNLDEEYSWSVTRGEKATSAAIPFEICPSSVVERLTDLSHEASYQSADPTERQLMLAYRLEEERCFYTANNTYNQLLQADPNNVLLHRMYATFLARMDMLPEASTLLISPR